MNPFLMTDGKRERYLAEKSWGLPTLHEVFAEKAKKHPDKLAFVDSRTRLTYGEAERYIDRLALSFAKMGFAKDDVVAIQLPNIVESALLRIALPRAGILVVMLMPALEAADVARILNLTNAKGIVIPWRFKNKDYFQMMRDLYDDLKEKPRIFIADQEIPADATFAPTGIKDLLSAAIEDEYSPLILQERMITTWEVQELNTTTGSTGTPKVSEAYGWNQLLGYVHAERWRLRDEDVLGLVIPFPGGIANNFWSAGIVGGCTMAFLEQFEAKEALAFIQREKISILFGVPTVADHLVKAENLADFDINSLRIIFLAGAPTPPTLAEEIEKRLNCKTIILLGSMDFGPISETSVDDPPEIRYSSVGKPLRGTEVKVVNEQGEKVPAGTEGELMCRGPYSFSGYYKMPELTLESYGGDKDGWFRTGDLVKVDEEGHLFVVGRLKDIIKRGGMTIAPGEMENILRQHPAVMNAAVVPMPDPVLGERACAFVILKQGRQLSLEEITLFLSQKGVAKYKWPERLEVVAEFPMLGDQKIAKKKLSEMVAEKLRAESGSNSGARK